MEERPARAEPGADHAADGAQEAQRRARGRAAQRGERAGPRHAVGAESRPRLEAAQRGVGARAEAAVDRAGREAVAREQELQPRDIPAARPRGQRPAAEPRTPAAAERAARPRAGDAVDGEAAAALHAADGRPGRRAGDAVHAARVDALRAQGDLERRDVGGRARERGRDGRRSRARRRARPRRRGSGPHGSLETGGPPMPGLGAICARRGSRCLVRGGLAGLVVVLALLFAAPASAASKPRGPLAALRRGDLGVVRRDDRRTQTGLPADSLNADGTRSVADLDDEHRRVHVEHAGRRAAAGSSATREAVDAARPDADDARAHGAPRAERPVLQLVRPPHRREADDLAAERRAADADPLLGRQRLAGGRPARRGEPRAGAACARAGAVRLDGLRLLLPARASTGSSSTTCPTPARRPAATTRSSPRAGSPSYIGIEKGEIPQRQYYGAFGGPSRSPATGRGSRRGRSASPAPTSA